MGGAGRDPPLPRIKHHRCPSPCILGHKMVERVTIIYQWEGRVATRPAQESNTNYAPPQKNKHNPGTTFLLLLSFPSLFDHPSHIRGEISKYLLLLRLQFWLKSRPGGGIGRHAGLKILWPLKPYGFDSRPGYNC